MGDRYCKNEIYIIHDGVPYHIGTILLIYSANEWTGFYIIGTSIMEELNAYCAESYAYSESCRSSKRVLQNKLS